MLKAFSEGSSFIELNGLSTILNRRTLEDVSEEKNSKTNLFL